MSRRVAPGVVLTAGLCLVVGCLVVGCLVVGCNWGRFNKLKEDAPVVRLEPPDYFDSSFGDQLAATWNEETAVLYVGGVPWGRGGMTFSLGLSESPNDYPLDSRHCELSSGDVECRAAQSSAGLSRGWGQAEEQSLCFVTGVAEEEGQYGLYSRCLNREHSLLPLPPEVDGLELFNASEEGSPGLSLTANSDAPQLLLAAHAAQASAWFYPPGADEPVLIPVPAEAGADFGKSAAVASSEEGHLLFVAAPAQEQLWVFRYVDKRLDLLACLGGEPEFGRALATGDMDGDGLFELAVSSEREVLLLSGDELGALPSSPSASCFDSDALEEALLERIECSSAQDLGGCGGSAFGVRLAIADVDGNGRGLVGISAPRMTVLEQHRAGAVFLHDVEGTLVDVLRISNPEKDDELGVSLVSVSQGEREIFAAGTRRSRFAYLFYCLGAEDPSSSRRCE